MYTKLEDAILIKDKSKLQDDDPVVYERIHRGERVFTLDNEHKYNAPAPTRYGRMYEDVSGNLCIVPDTREQFEKDCWVARNSD